MNPQEEPGLVAAGEGVEGKTASAEAEGAWGDPTSSVLERSRGLGSGARARCPVEVAAWEGMSHSPGEAGRVGAAAGGGGCARGSRSTSARPDCVQRVSARSTAEREGWGWRGCDEIVRNSHAPEQGGGWEGVCSRAPCRPSPGWGQPPTSELPGPPHSAGFWVSTALLAPREDLFFPSALPFPVRQPVFEFSTTHWLGKLEQAF